LWKLGRSQFTINSITLSKEWNHQWFYSLERVMKATANSDQVSLNHKDSITNMFCRVDHRLPLWKLAIHSSQLTPLPFPRNATLHEKDPWFLGEGNESNCQQWPGKFEPQRPPSQICSAGLTIAFLCENLPVPSSQLTPLPFPRNATLHEKDPWFLGEGNESNCQQWLGKFEPQRPPSQICFAGWPSPSFVKTCPFPVHN